MAVIQDIVETVCTLKGVPQVQAGMSEMQGSLVRFGIAAGVATAGLKFIADAAKAAAEDQAQYTRAVGNFKGSFPLAEMEAATDQLRLLTGVGDDVTTSMYAMLGTFQLTGKQAQALGLPILNAAAALHESADEIAVAVGAAIESGSSQRLKRAKIFGIDDAAFAAANKWGRVQMVNKALMDQGGDAAERFRKTTLGAAQAAASAWQEVMEVIGKNESGPWKNIANTAAGAAEAFLKWDDSAKNIASTVALVVVGAMVLYAVNSAIVVAETIAMTRELAALELQARRTAGAVGSVGKGGVGGVGGGGKGGIAGGILASLGFAGIEAGMQAAPKHGIGGALATGFGRTAEGALIGGQIAGVPGAVAGAVAGALVGAIENTVRAFGGKGAGAPAKDPHLVELEKINANLQKQLDEQAKANTAGNGFSAKDLPVIVQRYAGRGARV